MLRKRDSCTFTTQPPKNDMEIDFLSALKGFLPWQFTEQNLLLHHNIRSISLSRVAHQIWRKTGVQLYPVQSNLVAQFLAHLDLERLNWRKPNLSNHGCMILLANGHKLK